MSKASSIQQQEWERTYSSDSFFSKNEYPSEAIISFTMHHFGHVTDKQSIKVLDLGCGWGNNLKFLKDKGFDYYGVDFSESAVAHCRREHDKVFCCNLQQLPFADQTFDFIFDRMAIQHNTKEQIAAILAEVYRVLKPGALFYSALVNQCDYDYLTTYLSIAEIEQLLAQFSSVEIDYSECSYNNRQAIARTYLVKAIK